MCTQMGRNRYYQACDWAKKSFAHFFSVFGGAPMTSLKLFSVHNMYHTSQCRKSLAWKMVISALEKPWKCPGI